MLRVIVENPGWLALALVLLPAVALALRVTLVDHAPVQRVCSAIARASVIALLLLALAQVIWVSRARDAAVIVLVDASDSVPADAVEQLQHLLEELTEAQGPNDWVGLASFARDSITVAPAGPNPPTGLEVPEPAQTDATDVGRALHHALDMLPPGKVPRVLLLSDGNDTEGGALSAARRMAALGVPLHTIPFEAPDRPEVLLRDLVVPAQVAAGEPFRITCVAESTGPTPATFTLYRDGFRVDEQTMLLPAGRTTLAFQEPRAADGPTRYELRVAAEHDTFADNNVSQGIVYAAGEPRVLLLDGEPRDARHLARALESERIRVDVRDGRGMPSTLDELAAFDAVIYSDLPSHDITTPQIALLRRYVEELGGGFIMIGGEHSFNLGGYHATDIEGMLPLRMRAEQREDQPGLAMVLVIDKSGSMTGDRITLAREAAVAAVEMLTPRDEVGVVTFDSSAHWAVPLQGAGNQLAIIQAIQGITPGGGTNIYPAMVEAYEALSGARAANKHVVLLSDGHSQPGDFSGITERMAMDRITVSTVGVGEGADAYLLQDIARWGRGRYYFTADPFDIPQIFTQETMTAARSSLIEEPFLPVLFRSHQAVRGIEWGAAPFLFGYVATTPKPTAEVPLATERGEPLLALWRVGMGQVAAFTSDAKGRWASDWLPWPGYTQFWAQVVRQVAREPDAGQHETTLAVRGDRLHLTVDAFDEDGLFLNGLRVEAQGILPDLSTPEVTLTATAPGRYEGSLPLAGVGTYLARIQLWPAEGGGDPLGPPFTRGIALSYLPEYRDLGVNDAALMEWANITGGTHRPALDAVFAVPVEGSVPVQRGLWSWLLAAALLVFVADVALRRVDLRDAARLGAPGRYG